MIQEKGRETAGLSVFERERLRKVIFLKKKKHERKTEMR